ncbi:MAG: peptidylprolyl isomerase [Euryarchaeota archaeon]|jgi:peptidyl-prolyl cis-trans isomerase C|nr:peptidylprolyl isomerase [Euryarchaeota archaeon]
MVKRAHASHILIASKSQAIQITDKINSARKPLKEFQKMARKHSSCPSGSKGGDLGWFHEKQMVKEFSAKVWEQELKAIDGFIKTGFGYHIIWVHERDDE